MDISVNADRANLKDSLTDTFASEAHTGVQTLAPCQSYHNKTRVREITAVGMCTISLRDYRCFGYPEKFFNENLLTMALAF